jgi:putative ABC transport system ATP-binding protein
MNAVVRAENLTKSFRGPTGKVRALLGVSFSVVAGELAVVQGPSGCGKTTLLLILGGLLQPDSGCVCIDGKEVQSLFPEQRAQFRSANIGFVFQQFHLVPYLSVRENVLTPALGRVSAALRERAGELIARFGLQERARHLPSELSTGERQRTALARALLNQPKVLLADEPTGNLDSENAETVWKCLHRFADEGGTVLVVTHDDSVAQHSRQVLRLANGRLVA